MKRFRDFILVFLLLTACAPRVFAVPAVPSSNSPTGTNTLVIFAAASLVDAFTEIGKSFEAAHPGVTVAFNFAGSQALRTQMEEGADADVFASANQQEMNTLVLTDTLVAEGTPQLFLTNMLQVILPAGNPENILSLDDLSTPGIKLVLAAEEVPVGKYARQALTNLNGLFGKDYRDAVMANVVSNENNVKQVVTKVQLGEADAGIVYVSDAVAAPDLLTLEIPADYNVIAQYPIAPLIAAPHPELANEFIAYVLSPEGQSILKKWGFTPIQP